MLISGLQKLTLLDYPGRVACTVFTGGCDFRCPFCHNPALVLPDRATGGLSVEELLAFLETRRGKLDGVCITGGEPTLHEDLPMLLRQIRGLGFAVKLDTNGTRPKAVKRIIDAGLADMIAMDIKNSYEKHPETCGISGYDTAPIRESIQIIMSSGIDYEFRTAVMREFHTPDDIRAIAKEIQGAKGYFLQAYRDSGDILKGGCSRPTDGELHALLSAAREYLPNAELRGVE